jgi:hypothetical protein
MADKNTWNLHVVTAENRRYSGESKLTANHAARVL